MTSPYQSIDAFSREGFFFDGAYVIAQNDQKALLLSKTGTTLALSSSLLQALIQHQLPGLLALKLIQRGFAKTKQYIPAYFACAPKPKYFIIDLTGNCNYSCIYCFRDSSHSTCSITGETLRNIMDYIIQYCESSGTKSISIQAWGGEPLLAADRLLEMAAFFRSSPIHAAIDIETNASLITEELAGLLRSAGIRLGISIDGPEWVQNTHRPSKGPHSSYQMTMAGIETVRKHFGDNFGIISVVTKHSIHSAHELVSFFRDEQHFKYVKFNLVRDNQFAREQALVPSLEQVEAFYSSLFDAVIDGWKNGKPFTEGTIQTRLENLLYASRKNCCESCGCTGGRAIFSFDRSGNIFPCEMTDFQHEKIGSIYEPLSLESLLTARKDSLFFQTRKEPQCDVCPWWFYCRGGCTSRVHYANETGIDRYACIINKTLYPRIAQFLLEDNGLISPVQKS